MALFGFLRGEISRYRKRKQLSIDGTVAGLEHNEWRGVYDKPALRPSRSSGPPAPAQLYDPAPGDPQFPGSHYQPYEWENHIHPTPQLRVPPRETPEIERPPDYNDSLMTDDLLQETMQECSSQSGVPEPIPVDQAVRDRSIMSSEDSLEERVLSLFETDPIQEIEQAIDQQMQGMGKAFAAPEPQPEFDPYLEEQRLHDEMMQLMAPFEIMGPGMGPGPMI